MGILFPQFIETSSNKDTTTSISTDLEISSLSLSAYQPPWHHWPFPSFSNSSPGLWDMQSSGCPPVTQAHLHKEAILSYHRGSPSASFAGSPSSLPPVTVRAPRAWSLVLVINLISAILRCTYSPPLPHFNISESGHILPSLCLKIMFGRWELRGIFIAYPAPNLQNRYQRLGRTPSNNSAALLYPQMIVGITGDSKAGVKSMHYSLNICAPQMHILKPYPQCDSIWRWGLWEVNRFRWGLRVGPSWWD